MSATLPVLNLPDSPPSAAPLPGILDVPAETLRAWLAERGQPPMRVNQIRRQILAGRAESFDAMSDLPKPLRAELAAAFAFSAAAVERHLVAKDDTHRLALGVHEGAVTEGVLIQDAGGATACISTQVGCGMGCVFCASGLNGVVRNLTAGEILEQLVRLRNLLHPEQRLTQIGVMGMGEPLASLDSLLEALAAAGAKEGLAIGARH